MNKTFEIRYYQNDHIEDDNDFGDNPYPTCTSINFEFEFGTGVTWDVILWQFCKVLEATGYEGVRERVRLVDRYNFMSKNNLFECINPDEDFEEWGDLDDTEEDEEEGTDEEKEVDFQDIKKEIA
jgi:hypothetical protein